MQLFLHDFRRDGGNHRHPPSPPHRDDPWLLKNVLHSLVVLVAIEVPLFVPLVIIESKKASESSAVYATSVLRTRNG